ncbi:MAG: sulfate ABC transporter substrate-binding protein [Actinomycetota bacterium]|nr:sulfate ABC transporter substrate-binding protein [Actinomycetota bacterium]
MTKTRFTTLIAGLLALSALVVAGCGSDDSSSASGGGGGEIALVAYSTPQQAYEEGVIPGFQKTAAGEGVEFSTSFGASGDQRRAVESGLPADVVAFSLEPDMTKTVDAGLVAEDWSSDEYKGMVTDSVVVLSVRPGNPKNIEGWNDLVRDDVDIITPNPATSGGAKWNIMAAYGSQIEQGKSEQEALDFVKQVLANTSVQDDSARDSLQTFAGGKGDVLIGYENEAIQAQDEDIELEFVIPDETILIENPIAVTTDGGDTAQKFVDYTRTDDAQQLFADRGYRPVVKSVLETNRDKFPEPSALFTIEKFGGWDKVETDFFDEENGSIFEIQRELGNPTE